MGHILRVASYNLRDFRDDADAAARVVRAIHPDVLCLQEVPRRLLSGPRIARFADQCGLHWSGGHRGEWGWRVVRRGSGGTTVMSGPGVTVAGVEHHGLRVARLNRERGYAVIQVTLPGAQRVTVASVHLSLNEAERVAHVKNVLAALHEERALVVAGDLNEGRDGAAWAVLARRLRKVTNDTPTFPAGNPQHCIDVIFATTNLEVVQGEPVELTAPDLVNATDHLPVWVDLAVP